MKPKKTKKVKSTQKPEPRRFFTVDDAKTTIENWQRFYADRNSNRKTLQVIVKAITGREAIEYETRLFYLGVNVLVGRSNDKRVQQALAKDLFNLLSGVTDTVLRDYVEGTETRRTQNNDLALWGVRANEFQKVNA